MLGSRTKVIALVLGSLTGCARPAIPEAGTATHGERFARVWPLPAPANASVSSIEEKDGRLTVSGRAASFDEVSELMRALNNIALHSRGLARVVERQRSGVLRLQLSATGEVLDCLAAECGLLISSAELRSTVLTPDGRVAFDLDVTLNAL